MICPFTSGKCEWDRRWPHNPETGRSTEFDSPGQRRSYLTRNPGVDPASLPPVRDPNRALPWDDCSTIDGAPASLQRKYERIARETALLKDPVAPVQRREPTKPDPRRHRDSERAMAVAWHEAGHCVLSLMVGQRVKSATIVPGSGADGHAMIQNSGNWAVDACITLAGQVADEMSGAPMSRENYKTDNQLFDKHPEIRQAFEPLVRGYLTEHWGAVDEIAKELLLRETLSEFQIKLAYVRGLQKWKAKVGTKAVAPGTSGTKLVRYADDTGPVEVRSATISMADERTVNVRWTSGASVRRRDQQGYFDEELATGPDNVRLGRLNAGAPFLNSHEFGKLSDIIGAVVKGSARMEGGFGFAQVRLSARPEVAGYVSDIRDGIISNVSVGYRIHAVERDDAREIPVVRVVDWEPLEISAVAIPADPSAGIG